MSGGGTGTSKDQLKEQNDLQKQQLAEQTALRNQMLGNPSTRGSIASYLGGGIGYDPATLAAMTSQFLNNNTNTFNQAGAAVRSALASRGAGGGDLPVGGDYVRGIASLEGAKASSQSQGLLGLNVQNAQQAIQNQFNAANVASGQTAQIGQNIGIFGQGANNALDEYVRASNQGFGSAFMQGLGGSLGQGLGKIATGGFGGAVAGMLPSGAGASSGFQSGINASLGIKQG